MEHSGPFALCFGNEKGAQDAHYHPHHLEIYFSEHPLEAEYRLDANSPVERVKLDKGGCSFSPQELCTARGSAA